MEILTWTFIILIILFGIVAGILLSIYFLQDKLIFNPIRLPMDYHFPFKNAEEYTFKVADGADLNCLLFKSKESKGLIFYIHGNADNLRYWGDFAEFFTDLGYDVFMYDFRSFGKSTGKIKNERNLQRDNKILYKRMVQIYGEDKIIVYGFSIGTGLAARLANRNRPKMLILEAPYYHFISLIKYHKAYLPASWITKYHFRINRYLSDIKVPTHIFHGTEDRKVPYFLGERLKGIHPLVEFHPVVDATHSDMQSMEYYQRKMKEILA
jgi:alpha-beta hydrolase superfamily lysophospholipase